MSTSGGDPPFTVSYAAGVIDLLRGWEQTARSIGMGRQFRKAIRDAELELQTRPREWGDPQFDFSHLSMTVYQRSGPILIVRYAVHATRPVVFVREVVLTPGSRLAEERQDPD